MVWVFRVEWEVIEFIRNGGGRRHFGGFPLKYIKISKITLQVGLAGPERARHAVPILSPMHFD